MIDLESILQQIAMKQLIPFLILTICIPFIASGQPPDRISTALKENIKSRIASGRYQGIVVALIDDSGVQYYSHGTKAVDQAEKVDENTIFEIGSISKTFTGLLLAQEVLKGEVNLTDPVKKYVPDAVKVPSMNEQDIQMVHLANHTSGLPSIPTNLSPANPLNPYTDYGERKLLQFLNTYKLDRGIGIQYEYSNYGMGLLGYLLAKKQGLSYEDLVRQAITLPLQMENTAISISPRMNSSLAIGHSNGNKIQRWDFDALAGAGAIRSNAVDMAKYISANMGKIPSPLYESMKLAHKNSTNASSETKVGLGWHIYEYVNSSIIWHNGGTGGFRSFTGFTADGKRGVVVLGNSDESVDDIGLHILNPQVPLQVIQAFPETVEVAEDILDAYIGQYQTDVNITFTITKEDNQLYAEVPGEQAFPIFPESEDIFFYKIIPAKIRFNLDEEGVVESMTFLANGREVLGKKID